MTEETTAYCAKCYSVIPGGIDAGHECREVIRCSCGLNQFLTKDGLCRKPDCRRPLKSPPLMVVSSVPSDGWFRDRFINGEFYRPEVPFMMKPLAETEQAMATLKRVFKSNVRLRGKPLTKINKQPRYQSQGLSIRDFPTELRFACLEYAAAHGMTLREVVINSLKKFIDTE